jgi:sugar/nucleoside kinase (ribokinase family)
MSTPDIVIAGIINIDSLLRDQNRRLLPGGNLSHIVTAFQLLNLATSRIGLCATVGSDYEWTHLLHDFDQRGICFTHDKCNRVDFVYTAGQYRFHSFQSLAPTDPIYFPPAYRGSQYLLIGALSPKHVRHIAAQYDGFLALNYSPWFEPDEFYNLIPRLDLVVMNRSELLTLHGDRDMHTVYNQHYEPHNTELIVTQDEQGCSYLAPSYRISVPALPVKCEWKYGAGAVFSSLFLLSVLQGSAVIDALALASTCASTYVSDDRSRLGDADFVNSKCALIRRAARTLPIP